MLGVGVAIILVGVWVVYCGYNGMNPLTTVTEIIRNPARAQEIIAQNKKAQVPVTSSGGNAVVAFARAQLGKPYRLGGKGPDYWDCSGLAMMAYRQVGIQLPHSSSAQMMIGARISKKSELQPGDLVFPSTVATVLGRHVQIWTGSGTIIEAPRPGLKVREVAPWGLGSGESVRAVRPR